jgi:acyl-coenzyme A thioesterase PaaI-like protein
MTAPIPADFKPITLPGGFEELVGPLYWRRDGDTVRYGFRAEAKHANPNGVVHGGMLTTVIDHCLGSYVWHAIGRKPCATVTLNCSFIAAGRPGDWIEASGAITRRGRSLVFVDGALTCGDKTLLTAKGVWKVLDGGG